jgi:hypothetical protein
MTSMTDNEKEFQETYSRKPNAENGFSEKSFIDLIRHNFTTDQLTVVGPAFFKSSVTIFGRFLSIGTNTNDNAPTGYVGEYLSSAIASASAVTLTNNQYNDVTSLALTAGDWDVSAMVMFTGTITGTNFTAGIGTSSGNASTGLVAGDNSISTASISTAASDSGLSVPTWRTSLSASKTYYLKAFGLFSIGTLKAYGRISARRVR